MTGSTRYLTTWVTVNVVKRNNIMVCLRESDTWWRDVAPPSSREIQGTGSQTVVTINKRSSNLRYDRILCI